MTVVSPVLLLVSVDEADRRLVGELVAEATDVHWVTTLNAGLAALAEHSHDVVLITAELAGDDGIRRLIDEDPQTAVILLEDESDAGRLDGARELGAVDHLPRRGLSADTLQRALRYAVDQRRTLERLRYDALHDALTGLPNRTLFLDRLRWSLRRARRPGARGRSAVLFLDLDRFKAVNDSLGHQAGDELLQAVAQRIGGALRPGDTVARLGGDEFTVLLENIADAREATAVAERIQHALADPITVAGRELRVSTSIGIALAGRNGDAEALIRDADVAMYRAKGEGTARHAVFDAELHTEVRARLELEEDLRRAIADETLELRYQPIVRTATGAVGGFEALWRWEVDASDLLRIAEASGLIAQLGRYVLREAARRAAEWDMVVSVNVSARQLRDEGFADSLAAALTEAGATPEHLRLEVTERAIDQDAERTLRTLHDLRERLGVRTYLDDFGTGTSSLRFLHRFPGDALKIDCGLVRGMLDDPASEEIVKAVVGLAHSLGMEVVAVGAETAQHLERLAALGCEYAQGFHLATPLTADEVRDFLDGRAAGALV